MCEELYNIDKVVGDKSSTIQFVVDEESVLFVDSVGQLSEQLQQSGWSFQDDEWNTFFQDFIEEVQELDLLEWTYEMELNETVKVSDSLTITREG